jgi:hypothetical protein
MSLLSNMERTQGSWREVGERRRCSAVLNITYYAVPLNAKFALDGARGLRHVPIIRCS